MISGVDVGKNVRNVKAELFDESRGGSRGLGVGDDEEGTSGNYAS